MRIGEPDGPSVNAMDGAGTAFLRLLHDTRGFTAVLLALTISLLIGFSALGVETGLWYAIKRQNQSGADVAALSGAMEHIAGKPYSDICALAKLGAQANDFTVAAGWSCPVSSPTNTSDCTSLTSGQMCVNNPPLFGNFAGVATAVEVVLAQQQNGFLASLWQANVTVDTRAVAGLKAFPSCMIALGTSGTDLKNNGNATLTLNNCSFASNSVTDTNPDYSVKFNGGVTMTAAAISTAGGIKVTGTSNFIAPPVTTHAAAVPDPYNPSGTPLITVPSLGASLGCPKITSGANNFLLPGSYGGSCAGGTTTPIEISGGTTALCSGVYLIDGDDNQGRALWIHNNGTVVSVLAPNAPLPGGGGNCPTTENDLGIPYTIASGVTIITTCSTSGCGGGFRVGSTGGDTPTVTLTAPTTSWMPGIPKQILFYQVKSPAADTGGGHPGNSTFGGGSGVSLNGVIYTPSTEISLQGNPSFGSCTEMIANDFVIGGTPVMNAPLGTCGIITESVSTLVLLE
jgi:Flp pilus assembly protein TadG